MRVGDKVYGEPGVFFPTHSGRGVVTQTYIDYGYFSSVTIEVAVVQLENGEEHTVPVSSLIVEE